MAVAKACARENNARIVHKTRNIMLILVLVVWFIIIAVAILLGRTMAGRSLRRLEMLIAEVRPLCQHPDAPPAALAALCAAEKEHQSLKGRYLEDLIDRSNAAYLALQSAAQQAGSTVLAGESARRSLSKAMSQAQGLKGLKRIEKHPELEIIYVELERAEHLIDEHKFNDATGVLIDLSIAMDFLHRVKNKRGESRPRRQGTAIKVSRSGKKHSCH
jgi:hypothetical protein